MEEKVLDNNNLIVCERGRDGLDDNSLTVC